MNLGLILPYYKARPFRVPSIPWIPGLEIFLSDIWSECFLGFRHCLIRSWTKRGPSVDSWKSQGSSFVFTHLYEFFFFNFICLFLRERGRECMCEGQRERETENPKLDAGLDLMSCEITTWAEIKSWLFNRLSLKNHCFNLFCVCF